MGSSSSKPSKSKSSKTTRKISKPSPPIPHTPLSYPHLEPLPLPPLPHHPNVSRPDPYQEFAGRYGRLLADNPIYAGTKKVPQTRREAVPVPQQARVKESRAKNDVKAKAPYQFRPLNEIGRGPNAPKAKPQSQTRPQPPRQAAPPAKSNGPHQFKPLNEIGAPRAAKRGDVLPPIAPLKINHKNNNNSRPEAAAGKKPHARFGATRQDRHGEWWVLVLADGQWHRSREMGLVPPGGV